MVRQQLLEWDLMQLLGRDFLLGQQLGRTIVGSSHSCAIGSRAAGSLVLQLGDFVGSRSYLAEVSW